MEMSFSMRCGRRLGIVAVAAVVLGLSACGGKEEAPPAPPPASTTATPAPAAPVVMADEESVVVQPTLVDTLSADELVTRADQAMKENQLFVPSGESAFEMYLRVTELEPEKISARNAMTDLFPYAVLYVEQRTAAGDLPESERVLDLMERADARAPALPRLQRAVEDLRNRVMADAQRAATQAAAAAAAAAAPPPPPPPTAAPEPVAPAPVASAPEPAPSTPEPAPPVATAPVPVAPAPAPPPPPAAEPAMITPTVVSSVQPRYPPPALRRRVEGSVELGFTIMPDGSVSNVRVLSSRPGNTFDREAINAMERWRFTPPGRQVESRRVFDFKLD